MATTKKKVTKKTTSKKRTTKKATTKKTPAKKGESKMAKATKLYKDMTKRGLPRMAIIEAFQQKAGLTKAGSATYYQIISKREED